MKREIINKEQKIILKMLFEYLKLSKEDKGIFVYYMEIFVLSLIKSLNEINNSN